MKNKVLAMLLALCMVMSLLPVTVFATDDESTACSECGCDPKCEACEDSCGCGATTESEAGSSCGEGCSFQACDDEDCADFGKVFGEGDHEEHTYTKDCACKTHTKGEDGKYTACNSGKKVAKEGDLCEDCAEHFSSVPACKHAKTADTCLSDTHADDCIEACTGLVDCPATGAHQDGCKAAAVAAGTMKKDSVEYTHKIDCACTLKHIDGNCTEEAEGADCANALEITKTVEYAYEPGADADATKTAKDAAEQAAIDALKDELDEENEGWLCDTCKAYKTSKCTGKADCPADDGFHKANCVHECDGTVNCPNDPTNPAAHQIKYVVYAAGEQVGEAYATRTAAVDALYGEEGIITALKDAVKDAEGALDEAKAALAELEKGDEGYADAKTAVEDAEDDLEGAEQELADELAKGYIIVEEHCKSLGIPDSTYVVSDNVDDSKPAASDDNKTEEVKAPEKAADFDDLDGTEWYAEELTALMAKGIVKGSLDAGKYTFKATDKMTTDFLVVFLSRVLEKGFKTEGAGWADEAKAWAAEEGLLEGIEAGEVARKDVVLVLWRAMGKPEAEQDLSKFEDAAELEGDALAAMQWAVSVGVIKGDGDTGTLKVNDVITRAEMIAVLARVDGLEK